MAHKYILQSLPFLIQADYNRGDEEKRQEEPDLTPIMGILLILVVVDFSHKKTWNFKQNLLMDQTETLPNFSWVLGLPFSVPLISLVYQSKPFPTLQWPKSHPTRVHKNHCPLTTWAEWVSVPCLHVSPIYLHQFRKHFRQVCATVLLGLSIHFRSSCVHLMNTKHSNQFKNIYAVSF